MNGGTNSSENPSSYNVETETFTLKAPTKTGYIFSGWTGSNGTTSQTSVKITKGTTGNKNYTANWNPITYKVKYNGNGATSGTMENSVHTYDVAKNLNANNYTKAYTVSYNYDSATGGNSISSNTGTYTFSGWAETASGDKKYDNLASVKNLSSTNNATVNLYAKWTVGTVKLPTPTKTNYKFVGWYSNASKTAFVGNGGDNYSPTSNITLYAKWVLKTTTFYYTGGVQSYTAPITGTYKLEVWGAQGGTDGYSENCTGGKGGYSYGNIYLNANTTIYIVVGGKGSMEYKHFSEGGYNGGGSAFCNSRGEYGDFDQHVAISGGGATHIATTNRGELKNYKSYVNELKIVAGGGGANAYHRYPCLPGGDGGGTKGTDGVSVTSVQYDFRNLRAHGGTQYEPGYYSYSSISANSPCYKHSHYNYYCSGGNFGLGADGNYVGGGGGLYGGGVAFVSAGGGSGYIGGVSSGGMINGQRSGDGLANITIQ